MAAKTYAPYAGPWSVDITDMKDEIVDLPDKGTQRLHREKEGLEAMARELAHSVPDHGAKAGISKETYDRFLTRTARITRLRERKAAALKIAEVIGETEASEEHAREGDIAVMAKSVKTTAERVDPAVAGNFEELLRYYSQVGDKAAATRRKNAEAAKQQQEELRIGARARQTVDSGVLSATRAAREQRAGQHRNPQDAKLAAQKHTPSARVTNNPFDILPPLPSIRHNDPP